MSEVLVANCRLEGSSIYLPFHLQNREGTSGLVLEGKIDTGFSGYILVPFNYAQICQLNLAQTNSGSWTLADGSSINTIDSIGMASIVGRKALALVVSPIAAVNPGILIGQKMLEAWNVKLENDPVSKVAKLSWVYNVPTA